MGATTVLTALEVTRPHNVAVALATTFIGFATAYAAAGLGSPLEALASPSYWLAAAVVALVAAGGYAINDYYDAPIDAVDKPWRPIPSGRISPGAVRAMALSLMAAGVALAALAGPLPAAYAAAAAVLVHEYSRWIKRRGLPGNLVVAFNSASSIVFGGLVACEAYGDYSPMLAVAVPSAYAFLLVLGREVVKGVEDYRGDLAGGVRTLAVTLGPRRASLVACALLLALVALSPLPFVAGPYGLGYLVFASAVDATAIYSIAVLATARDPVAVAWKARRALKLGFALGALAFTAGLIV